MKRILTFGYFISVIAVTAVANSFMWVWGEWIYMIISAVALGCVLALSGVFSSGARGLKMRVFAHGAHLLYIFEASLVLSLLIHAVLAFIYLPTGYIDFLFSMIYGTVCLALVFWVGIISVYLTSSEMGMKLRITGLLYGLVPVLNIIMLIKISKTVAAEIDSEIEREENDFKRHRLKLCKTKYPIVLVHGFFFRDFKYFNYWGRIPRVLKNNGATIYYGNHSSALAVKDSARELEKRIFEILKETGAEKVNVIAHSKGGLDTRYAISKLGMGQYIASLITVNTPHRGVPYADALLEVMPDKYKEVISGTYNKAYKKLGDANPDFLAAVDDLTEEKCQKFNEENPDFPKDIYVKSIGSIMNSASDGPFPLNFTYHFADKYGGRNDGLVAENSFKFGDNYTLIETEGERGVSHADIIDLTRTNLKGFDVREFYVELVNDLKEKGF